MQICQKAIQNITKEDLSDPLYIQGSWYITCASSFAVCLNKNKSFVRACLVVVVVVVVVVMGTPLLSAISAFNSNSSQAGRQAGRQADRQTGRHKKVKNKNKVLVKMKGKPQWVQQNSGMHLTNLGGLKLDRCIFLKEPSANFNTTASAFTHSTT